MTTPDPRRTRLVFEAVVSAYLRDISTRPGAGAPAPARVHDARADRLTHTRHALRRRGERVHARRTALAHA